MISATGEELETRARRWAASLGRGSVVCGCSTVGGGSLPGETLPTSLLALSLNHPNACLARLRQASPPVIARLEDDRLVFDPRTVLPEQEDAMLAAVRNTFAND
jgi:L-seryl-tRNA(Ser) seleniumtransferase